MVKRSYGYIFRRKRRNRIIILFVLFFFLMLFTAFFYYDTTISQIKAAFSAYPSAPMSVPFTITPYGRSSTTVSARLSWFTPKGTLVRTYERSWQGWQLKVECILFSVKEGAFVFPYRIFTDKYSGGTGTNLFSQYSIDEFPVLYDLPTLTENERNELKKLFTFIRTAPHLICFLGDVRIVSVPLRNFEQGKSYRLILSSNGSLVFKKE